MVFGETDAAPALAYLYSKGYGVKKDYAKLYIAIGDKLGNAICYDFMHGKNHEIYNIADFLKANPSVKSYSTDLINRAGGYARAAKENQQEYYAKNTTLTNDILSYSIKHFEATAPLHTIKVLEGFDNVKVTGDSDNSCTVM